LKQSYKYENIFKALENNNNKSLASSTFNGIKIEEEENLKLKKFFIIIQNLQEINKSFNDMKENIINIPNEPDSITFNFNNSSFNIYDNFMIMNEYTYGKILDIKNDQVQSMKKKNNYCECFFVDDLIFIILKKEMLNYNKKIIEVGTLTSEFIFHTFGNIFI
jgi:hypothetical protein